jgi:hypothetical protein
VAEFGHAWLGVVLSVIAGSFLFLAAHTMLPSRRKPTIAVAFVCTFLLAGGAALLQRRFAFAD